MHFVKGAEVYSSEGEKLGNLDRVVIDPKTREVTHLVIEKGLFFTTNKLVPLNMVNPEIEDHITLLGPKQDLSEFQDFEETHFVNLEQAENPGSDELPASYYYPPVNFAWWRMGGAGLSMPYYPGMPVYVPQTRQLIPEGTVALEEGARVISQDGQHVGNIEQVIVDTHDNRVTHFVVTEGVFFKERRLLPVLWISRIGEHEVHLSSTARFLERLPAYQASR